MYLSFIHSFIHSFIWWCRRRSNHRGYYTGKKSEASSTDLSISASTSSVSDDPVISAPVNSFPRWNYLINNSDPNRLKYELLKLTGYPTHFSLNPWPLWTQGSRLILPPKCNASPFDHQPVFLLIWTFPLNETLTTPYTQRLWNCNN